MADRRQPPDLEHGQRRCGCRPRCPPPDPGDGGQGLGRELDDLDIIDGKVISYRSEESISLKNIVIYGIPLPNDQGWVGGPVLGRGSFMPTYVTGLDPQTGQGPRAVVHYTVGAQAVEVEVDMDTGKVQVLRGVAAFDVGKAINPDMVRAQMEGGFVQG